MKRMTPIVALALVCAQKCQNAVPITADSFVRAETDLCFKTIALKKGGFGKLFRNRKVSPNRPTNVIAG